MGEDAMEMIQEQLKALTRSRVNCIDHLCERVDTTPWITAALVLYKAGELTNLKYEIREDRRYVPKDVIWDQVSEVTWSMQWK